MQHAWNHKVALSALALVLGACGGNGRLIDLVDTGDTTTTVASSSSGGEAEGQGEMFLTSSAIDFGAVDCGGDSPKDQKITLANIGSGPLTWSASLDSNVYFSLTGETGGTLQPGEKAFVVVSAGSMPSSAEAGSVQKATLLLSSNAALPETVVSVQATASGATFELVSPSVANFGSVPVGAKSAGIPVVLRNVGNAPGKVSVTDPGDAQFAFSWAGGPGAVEVAPGAAMPGLEATFTPSSSSASSDAGSISISGPVCGVNAAAIPVKGQGLAGIAGVSPGEVDLGKTSCGSTGLNQRISLYNTGNKLFLWNASFKSGANFSLSQSAGAVAAGNVVEFFVEPKKIAQTTNLADNGFGDTLVITTDVAGDTPKEIPVKQTAQGAILAWNATPLTFGTQAAYVKSAGKPVTITNTGNLNATVSVTGTGGFAATSGDVAANGGTLVSQVTFAPTNFGAVSGTYKLATDTPICQPLPAPQTATGTGKGAASSISLGGRGARRGNGEAGGCMILKDSPGTVACFGLNGFGQLGVDDVNERGPVIMTGLPEILKVSRGDNFACALGKDGTVWCWGNNRNNNGTILGKIGSNTLQFSKTPIQVAITDAVDVSAGHNVACAVTAGGEVKCWGTNRRGNLGSGQSGNNLNHLPQTVPGISTAKKVTASGGGGCAVLANETAWCWGRYRRGSNLGNGNTSMDGQSAPVQVSLSAVKATSGMTNSARLGAHCALYSTGAAACWGGGNYAQMGNGSCTGVCRNYYYTPTGVSGISGATQIVGISWGGCVLMGDKTVRCWGRNDGGQLGIGNTSNGYSTPVTVSNLSNVVGIGGGSYGVCAIIDGGSVQCWGDYGSNSSPSPMALRYFTP